MKLKKMSIAIVGATALAATVVSTANAATANTTPKPRVFYSSSGTNATGTELMGIAWSTPNVTFKVPESVKVWTLDWKYKGCPAYALTIGIFLLPSQPTKEVMMIQSEGFGTWTGSFLIPQSGRFTLSGVDQWTLASHNCTWSVRAITGHQPGATVIPMEDQP